MTLWNSLATGRKVYELVPYGWTLQESKSRKFLKNFSHNLASSIMSICTFFSHQWMRPTFIRTCAIAIVCISATERIRLTHSWRARASAARNLNISPVAELTVKVLESSSLGEITAAARCTEPRGRCFRSDSFWQKWKILIRNQKLGECSQYRD
jgi:hypothetical protein